ncbi:MAG: Glycosyl transferase family 2, partial [uncultured bacterium]
LDPASHRGMPTPWAAFTYFAKLEKLFPKSRLFGRYHQGWKNLKATHEVDVISGAFFLVRRQVIETVGVFDEGYFMYGEDVDWCMRIRKAGYKIAFVPSTKTFHVKSQSGRAKETGDIRDRKESKKLSNHYFWETMKLFYQKHYRNRYPRFWMWLIFRVINWQIRRTQ